MELLELWDYRGNMNHLLQTTDAKQWAKGFIETVRTRNLPVTEELMTVWFANAIMTGYDAARKQNPRIAVVD